MNIFKKKLSLIDVSVGEALFWLALSLFALWFGANIL